MYRPRGIKFIKINLHHSKAAMVQICQKLATEEINVTLT